MATGNGSCNNYCNGVVDGHVNNDNSDLMTNFEARLYDQKAKKVVLDRISTVTRPGLTKEELIKSYSDWVADSDYEQVRYIRLDPLGFVHSFIIRN